MELRLFSSRHIRSATLSEFVCIVLEHHASHKRVHSLSELCIFVAEARCTSRAFLRRASCTVFIPVIEGSAAQQPSSISLSQVYDS